MRLRFRKDLPEFVVANEIFYEKPQTRILCANFYKEDNLYKIQYAPSYLKHVKPKPLCDELPLQEEPIVSETVFKAFKNHLTTYATPSVYLKHPNFSKTDNVFYQLPLLSKNNCLRFFFEPVYKNNITIEDVKKICLFLEISENDLARILGCSFFTIRRKTYKTASNKLLLSKIHEFFSSPNVFEDTFSQNLKYVHSLKKETILNRMEDFFSQKYILWDKDNNKYADE